MNKIFADRALTEREAFALRAFLARANRTPAQSHTGFSAVLAGSVATVLCLLFLHLAWSRRLRSHRAPVAHSRRPTS